MEKFDKRRAYVLVLDCETATLPLVNEFAPAFRGKIALAKPLIYNVGWVMCDRKGKIYKKVDYLVSEIFSVPQIFNTAYYHEKKPLYLEKLRNGEIQLKSWLDIRLELENDCGIAQEVAAYNAMFDFKKAIPFTEEYINVLYSANYEIWENQQREKIRWSLENKKSGRKKPFNPNIFSFNGIDYPLIDIWRLATDYLAASDNFRKFCRVNGFVTGSGIYYSTTAETVFRYFSQNLEFDEEHTALADALIETEIMAIITKGQKKNFTVGIEYFPFRKLGKVRG